MNGELRRALSIFLSIAIVWTSLDLSVVAAGDSAVIQSDASGEAANTVILSGSEGSHDRSDNTGIEGRSGGVFGFGETLLDAAEGDELTISVVREGSTDAQASVIFKAVDVSAEYGKDYTLSIEGGLFGDITLASENVRPLMEATTEPVIQSDASGEAGNTVILSDASGEAGRPFASQTDAALVADLVQAGEGSPDRSTTSLATLYTLQTGQEAPSYDWREFNEESTAAEVSETIDALQSGWDGTKESLQSLPGVTARLTFAAGEYQKDVKVKIKKDGKAESGEVVAFLLQDAEGAEIGDAYSGYLNIADADEAEETVYSLREDTLSVSPDQDKAVVTIVRESGIDQIDFIAVGTKAIDAVAGEDYEAVAKELFFAAGVTEQTLEVPIIGRRDRESRFWIGVKSTGGALREESACLVTIEKAKKQAEISVLNAGDDIEASFSTEAKPMDGAVASLQTEAEQAKAENPSREDSVAERDNGQSELTGEEISNAIYTEDEEIFALGDGEMKYKEVTIYNKWGYGVGGNGTRVRLLDNIDLRGAEYLKVNLDLGGGYSVWNPQTRTTQSYWKKEVFTYLVDSATDQEIAPCIHFARGYDDDMNRTLVFRCENGGCFGCAEASIVGLMKGIDMPDSKVWVRLQKVTVGYGVYRCKINSNYDHMGEYREKIHTGEGKYENGKLMEYPRPYFTEEDGQHVEEKNFDIGQTVSASVWDGGGTNSQGVAADEGTLNFKGFKLAKPGAENSLSGFITTSDSFTFDVNFLNKYKDYRSSDGTFTLVPVYEPKGQTVEFVNDEGTVDGQADVKGVYDGFTSGYRLSATKLDTIRVSAKSKPGYNISSMVLQSPNGAMYNKTKSWTRWATRSTATDSTEGITLAAAVNYRGQMYTNANYTNWGTRDYCRVVTHYADVPAGSITMAPSPRSVNEGADGKLTYIQGPGAENDPNYNQTKAAGTTFTIDNIHLFEPYFFGATSKSGFHAYWVDGTLDTDGDGVEDAKLPGYASFSSTFGDQFRFIPKLPVKNKVYYNFVKDTYVGKEVKPLSLKGRLLLSDSLLLSGKKVQKGLGGITAFASGFKAGQEVKTDADGYYELESNDRFQYYDLYSYNVTFTGESEAGTIGVVYSQNPSKRGEVIVDASAEVNVTDVKLLVEQEKKGGSGKEYVTVDTSDAMLASSGGYFALPSGDRNFRLQMSAHRGSEVLAKGVLTFTNTDKTTATITGTEDASHSGLFTFDFNPRKNGIGAGATARVAFYVGDRALLSRDAGIKVADSVGTLRIVTTLASAGSGLKALGVANAEEGLIGFTDQAITLDWSGDFDAIADHLSDVYMDGDDRVVRIGLGKEVLSAGGEKAELFELARAAAMAQDEAGEAGNAAAIKAQNKLDEKLAAIQNAYKGEAAFSENLPMDLGYSLLMTFGRDDDDGRWYFKDMLCMASVDADSGATIDYETKLGLTVGVGMRLDAGGRTTFVVEERQDLTDEERKARRYYITDENKDSFDILSAAKKGEAALNSYGSLKLTPSISLTSCAGILGDMVRVEVDGRAEYDLTYGSLEAGSGACALSASIEVSVLHYSDRSSLSNGVYSAGESSLKEGRYADGVLNALSAGSERNYLYRSIDVLQAEDVSYMEGEDDWNGGWKDIAGGGLTQEIEALGAIDYGGIEAYFEGVLTSRIAPDPGFDMVSLGNGRFAAVFLNVPQGRTKDKDNSRAAYYTCFDGSDWSEPVILQDDGTLDQYPHIYSLGDKGALAVWSSVNADYKDTTDKIERQNALDLRGRFVDSNGKLDDDVLEITGTTGNEDAAASGAGIKISDFSADRVIGVFTNGDSLVTVYEKREYGSSGSGQTVGDMLYPKSSLIAYRTYDPAKGEWEDADETLSSMPGLSAIGGDAAEELLAVYNANVYGQKFYTGYLPEAVLYEDLDETGYYREGGSGVTAVKLDNPGTGMLLEGAAASYSTGGENIGVLAYTVDVDGDLSTLTDRELYLTTYDFEAGTFADPIYLTGVNVNPDASGAARPENGSPKFVSAGDALYLMWLRDGDVVAMNVGTLVQNESALVKEGKAGEISYRYIDKTPYSEGMTAVYDAPSALVSGRNASSSESLAAGAISAFDAETDGTYIYVLWPQEVDDRPESLKDGLKDIQMWGVKTNAADGHLSETTPPVQITSHYGERYDDVAFGVMDGELLGLASMIPSRMITASEAREIFDDYDEATFVPYAIWDDAGATAVKFGVSASGAARIENAGFLDAEAGGNASFSFEIRNYSFNELNGARVTAVSSGGSCTLYRYVPSETEDGEGETISATEGISIDRIGGGETYVVTGSLPLAEDAEEALVKITLADAEGNELGYVTITDALTPDVAIRDISISDSGTRNVYNVSGIVVNDGSARADAGVIRIVAERGSQDKTLLQLKYPSLMPGESYEFGEEDEDGKRLVELETSDDDFTLIADTSVSAGTAESREWENPDFIAEELQLYAVYTGRIGRYRIPVLDAGSGGDDGAERSFITRSISSEELETLGYVTGVQVDAVRAANDDDGYLTGDVVSSGNGAITLEIGEIVDLQTEILTNSPGRGAQAAVDEDGKTIETSTGTEGLICIYEYDGDNLGIGTDGMFHALRNGRGRLKVYVYPDVHTYTAENDAGIYTSVIDGDEFQVMSDEGSITKDGFHSLPAAAIRTFALDVEVVDKGERIESTDSVVAGGIRYRILSQNEVAACGVEDGKTMTTLTIPATVGIDGRKYEVTRIDAYSFNKDNKLKKVSIGKKVTMIGSGAFEGCENLTKVTLGSGLVDIGEGVFRNCAALSAITLPGKLERINAEAFYGCSAIKALMIPAAVTYIGDRAFYGCTGLNKITIRSEKLTGDSLGKDVFTGVPQDAIYQLTIKDAAVRDELTGMLTDESEQFTDKKGIIYQIDSKADGTLTVMGLTDDAAAKLKSMSIPAQMTRKGRKYAVTGIADSAFENNTKLTGVTIPGTVTAIGERAFAGDVSLKTASIPAAVKSLGTEAYSGCVKLNKVTIASPDLKVGEDAFTGVPDTATFKYAFKGDAAVIKLGTQLLSESSDFVSKAGLKYEILDPEVNLVLLTGSTDKDIKKLTVPDTVVYRGAKLRVLSVEDGAFAYHKKLAKVVIGKEVYEIGSDAFVGCTALTSVTMKGTKNIFFSAFKGCTSIKKITLPKTVSFIANDAFKGCTSLRTITIQSASPTELEMIGTDAFGDVNANAVYKISAKKKSDRETITRLLAESGVDAAKIK